MFHKKETDSHKSPQAAKPRKECYNSYAASRPFNFTEVKRRVPEVYKLLFEERGVENTKDLTYRLDGLAKLRSKIAKIKH